MSAQAQAVAVAGEAEDRGNGTVPTAANLLPALFRTHPREILVLKRARGYLRLHVPPLLYVPAIARQLETALLPLKGVRKVNVARGRARLSVFYDPWITDDREALLAIDRLATPLLDRLDEERFGELLAERERARRKKIVSKTATGAYFGALVWVHWWVMRRWLRAPGAHWWAWALLAYGFWMHRRQIKSIPKLPG